MQRISKIYLGNCGFSTAWYDGLTFDLTDPDSERPEDFVFNLENGGGKTSLLSLIFSCFETSQDRFLKHIQSKNNSFTQYFAQDGLPGLILVEWLMPARTAGGSPYRLVTGQVVAVKATAEPPECDRMFFSFEEQDSLSLSDIPGPKLGKSPVINMADFSRWIHEEQKKHSGNVYITRKQGDWQRHLRDERLIDLEMLQMQVNFSAQEGGFDTGFLNFHTEAEFLRKFFHLTLDGQRANEVRDAVALVCDKHRRKPQYQQRLVQLTKFQESLATFQESAQSFRQVAAEQVETRIAAARMAVALQNRAAQRKATETTEEAYAKHQGAIAEAAKESSQASVRERRSLESALHLKVIQRATKTKEVAEASELEAKNAIRYVKAARLLQERETQEVRINELEAQAELAREGLKPFQAQAETQGALLRFSLFSEETGLRTKAQSLDTLRGENQKKILEAKRDVIEADRITLSANKEHAQHEATERSFATQRSHLLEDKLLESAEEETQNAVDRWTKLNASLIARKAEALSNANRCKAESGELTTTAAKDRSTVARLEAEIEAVNTYLSQGAAERESLSQLPAMQSAVESDVADVDSPALAPALETAIKTSGREISLSDVRLAELDATQQAIQETGVALPSPDIATVVSQLQKAGVRSARPFNEYVAQAIQSVADARSLVLSDPAKFLGVSVASSEMEKVRKVNWDGHSPSRPVLISTAALDRSQVDTNSVVVPPGDDAAFNFEAAKAKLATLQERIAIEQTRRKTYFERQSDAMAALEKLRAFVERFGNGQLAAAQEKAFSLADDKAAAEARAEEADQKASEASEKASEYQASAQSLGEQAKDALSAAQSLSRFFKEFEESRPARLSRLDELVVELEDALSKKTVAEELIDSLTLAMNEELEQSVRANSSADSLGQERGTLQYYDKDYPAEAHLKKNPVDLRTLRITYADALGLFKSKEQDQLGVLQEKLQSAKNASQSKSEEFSRDFPGVTKKHVEPYKGMEHTLMLPELEAALSRAQEHTSSTKADLKVANQESKNFHDSNKDYPSPTSDMLSLDEADLRGRMVIASQNATTADEQMKTAAAESSNAHSRAKKMGGESLADGNLAKTLSAGLELGDAPNPELLILELAALKSDSSLATYELPPIVLDQDANDQALRLISEFTQKGTGLKKAQNTAHQAFDKLKGAAADKELQEVEPELARQMLSNDFNAACADASRLLEGLNDRIATTQETLQKMQADFDACVEEILAVTRSAISTLTSATNKKVPVTAPYVGGKAVLKMRANFSNVSLEVRRQALQVYMDSLTDTNVIPAKGSDLVAEAVVRIHGKSLGLQVLRMVLEESQQYVTLDKISNSGGEGVVMAMFLYVVISQLRAETQAKLQRTGGGPLILDNPFAKATTPALWKAQKALASAMGVQLIFATAIQDYNTLGEFSTFVRLRRAGQNTKTNRWHLETAGFKLNPSSVEAFA